MNAARVLEHFHRISDAPDAIRRMRRFILDRGARQVGVAGPEGRAGVGIAEADRRGEGAADEGKGRTRRRARNPIHPSSGWTWARFGDICSKTGSGSTPRGGTDAYQPSGGPSCALRTSMTMGLGWTTCLHRRANASPTGNVHVADGDPLHAAGAYRLGQACYLHPEGQSGSSGTADHRAPGEFLKGLYRCRGHKTLQMVERYSHQKGDHIQAAMDKPDQRYRGSR
jgi:hypothetical protein